MSDKAKMILRKIPLVGYAASWSYNLAAVPFRIRDDHKRLESLEHQLAHLGQVVSSSELAVSINEIKQLFVSGVEHYQPVYGLPPALFETNPKRTCLERAQAIERYFGNDLRGLRVLDIGSSLGYFCFFLADRGALTEGWDFNFKNCQVSNLAKKVNGIEAARFHFRALDSQTVEQIPYDTFDCVLGLSVFHHVALYNGFDYAQDLLARLLDRVPILIIEMANKSEDVGSEWKEFLPQDEMEFFARVKDCTIETLGAFDTHLSETKRTMYVVKRKLVTVNSHRYSVDRELYRPHKEFAFSAMERRYFLTKDHFVKAYGMDDRNNFRQIINEINILHCIEDAGIKRVCRLVDYELGTRRVSLVLSRVSGSLLSETLDSLSFEARDKAAGQVLEILTELERAKIFHNDIRSWNVMIDEQGGPFLIDFGLSSFIERENNLIAFAWLVDSLITGKVEGPEYGKTKLPDFIEDRLYLKYIAPISLKRVDSFAGLQGMIGEPDP